MHGGPGTAGDADGRDAGAWRSRAVGRSGSRMQGVPGPPAGPGPPPRPTQRSLGAPVSMPLTGRVVTAWASWNSCTVIGPVRDTSPEMIGGRT